MSVKSVIKYFTPPAFVDAARFMSRLIRSGGTSWIGVPEAEYVPQGWAAERVDPKIKGWNEVSVLEAQKARWEKFVKTLEGVGPFGTSPESPTARQTDLVFQNTLMCYAYVLTLASRHREFISILDWGGGIGHYYLISKTLVPDLKIEYHCKEVPVLAEYGKVLFPDANFYSDESCLKRRYELILASGSLLFSSDWCSLLARLARSTGQYLFVTRLPIVHRAQSFVYVQRPRQYGYNTEYLGWCLNRGEFLEGARSAGFTLMREFITGEQLVIHRAPEPCQFWGFLFRPNT